MDLLLKNPRLLAQFLDHQFEVLDSLAQKVLARHLKTRKTSPVDEIEAETEVIQAGAD